MIAREPSPVVTDGNDILIGAEETGETIDTCRGATSVLKGNNRPPARPPLFDVRAPFLRRAEKKDGNKGEVNGGRPLQEANHGPVPNAEPRELPGGGGGAEEKSGAEAGTGSLGRVFLKYRQCFNVTLLRRQPSPRAVFRMLKRGARRRRVTLRYSIDPSYLGLSGMFFQETVTAAEAAFASLSLCADILEG
ncbi:hypothetical protein SKAU_G00086750 [Synaphobranchus kaupii]|uniref:Uncharacterized protein n=1 Tax=Synaphobranchus kaupii TaxID=118154 RepID=A0A9Q1FWA6_SYNKA|nr:hypothetical protein SKAU_G00086750 [Synaphobranchus kaupii]